MGKLTIVVEYSDKMSMDLATMKSNIKYILNEHFKEMEGYKPKPTLPKVIEVVES